MSENINNDINNTINNILARLNDFSQDLENLSEEQVKTLTDLNELGIFLKSEIDYAYDELMKINGYKRKNWGRGGYIKVKGKPRL